ncbi:MAG: hypothetical protein ACOVO1_07220 [Chitinophagaceae bacterium]
MSKRLLLITFWCIALQSKAQIVDSILNKIAIEDAVEKVYIHFDKLVYSKAETVWFKAYIMDGSFPSVQSKNFYTDWYDDNGNLIKHNSYPIFQSTAKGQFEIPEKYSGSSLHVKAYTKWMLNSDTIFLFNKYLPVLQNNTPAMSASSIKTNVQFFPEGGDIVNGIGSFIAFKATNQFGKPIAIKGFVKNSKDELIDSIKTEHDGMGSFYIAEPNILEQYTAYYKDEFNNIEYTKQLPTVVDAGVAMQVQNLGNQISVTIKRTSDVTDEKKYIKLYGIINNMMVYKANIKLVNKTTQTLQIKTDSLPTGVMQFTLFNSNYVPLAERIVFIKNDNYSFNTFINTPLKNLTKRGKNVVDITVADTLLTNMSVSITDVNVAVDSATNMYSQLLLSSDIKGNINNPAYYFLKNDDVTQQHLDLVMLTNGWRRYNWQQIASGKMPYKKFTKDTSYLQVLGNTFGMEKNDLIVKPDIFLFLQAKDSSKKQMILPLRKDGSFGMSNFIFYDTLKVYYTFLGNNKLNRSAEVAFNNGLFNTPSKYNLDTITSKYGVIDYAYFEKQRKLDEEYKRLVNIKGSGVLTDVVVRAKSRGRLTSALDEKYTSGLFSGGDAYEFDLLNDTRAASAISVFSYLQGMVAGLQITQQDGETSVKWRQSNTSFFVDEINTDADVVGTLNVNDIAYIKVFRPPFFGGTGGSPGGAIAIYTRKGSDVKSTPGKGIPFKFLEGYASHKEFYSPNYEKQNDVTIPDVRTTLYWNPYILTDASKNKATIEFYNNDVSKKLRLILCGMNSDGKLTYIERIIE